MKLRPRKKQKSIDDSQHLYFLNLGFALGFCKKLKIYEVCDYLFSVSLLG